jgi:hypothetical protein
MQINVQSIRIIRTTMPPITLNCAVVVHLRSHLRYQNTLLKILTQETAAQTNKSQPTTIFGGVEFAFLARIPHEACLASLMLTFAWVMMCWIDSRYLSVRLGGNGDHLR